MNKKSARNLNGIRKVNLLIALFLFLMAEMTPWYGVQHAFAKSISVPMLFFWLGSFLEKGKVRHHSLLSGSYWKERLHTAFWTALFPALLSLVIWNLRDYCASDAQTMQNFRNQIYHFFVQAYWAMGVKTNVPDAGAAWLLFSLFWCIAVYTLLKLIPAWWGRIGISGVISLIGIQLAGQECYLPLALDVSMISLLFYTVGAEVKRFHHLFIENYHKRNERKSRLFFAVCILFAAFLAFCWLRLVNYKLAIGIGERDYQNPLAVAEAFAGIGVVYFLTCILVYGFHLRFPQLPSWSEEKGWVSCFILLHMFDWTTGLWWNQWFFYVWGSMIVRYLLILLAIDCIYCLKKKFREEPFEEKDYWLIKASAFLQQHVTISNVIFLLSFSLWLFNRDIHYTMFIDLDLNWTLIDTVDYYIVLIITFYAMLALVHTDSRKQFLLLLAIFTIGYAQWHSEGDYNLYVTFALAAALKDRSMKTILRLQLGIGLFTLLLAYVASKEGYIVDLTYESNGSHAMGWNYRTDVMAFWFYLLSGYLVLRNGKLFFFEYPLLAYGTYYLYQQTKALTGMICMALLLVLCLLHQIIVFFISLYKRKKHTDSQTDTEPETKKLSFLDVLMMSLYPIMAAFSYIVVLFFTDSLVPKLTGRSKSVAARLTFSLQAFRTYPITLLGQHVEQVGAGGHVPSGKTYFFLDNSYISILIVKGILVLTVVFVLIACLMKKALKNRLGIIVIVLLVISIHSLLEHHLIECWYNIFLILPFTQADLLRTGKKNSFRVKKQNS